MILTTYSFACFDRYCRRFGGVVLFQPIVLGDCMLDHARISKRVQECAYALCRCMM